MRDDILMIRNSRGGIFVWILLLLVLVGVYYGHNYIIATKNAEELKELKTQCYIKEEMLTRVDKSMSDIASTPMQMDCPITPTVLPTMDYSTRNKLIDEIGVLKQRIKVLEDKGIKCGLTKEEALKNGQFSS